MKIKETISNTVNENGECNPNTLWEVIKGNIRNETIKYSTHKIRENKKEELKIQNEIDVLQNKLNKAGISNKNIETITYDIDILKDKLNNIESTKINGILIRSRAEHIEYNEKNTKYFSNLEKHKAQSKTIYTLVENGEEIKEGKDILKIARNYFQKLYTKQNNNKNKIIFNTDPINKLNDAEKNKIEGKLNEHECYTALQDMENNKSPGSDGLSVEFYKWFWNDLKIYLISSINYSFENSNLTYLQKQGIITLLPKHGKDQKNISNWRPISLLNVDHKISTKAIANRIKTVLPNLITNNQTGLLLKL